MFIKLKRYLCALCILIVSLPIYGQYMILVDAGSSGSRLRLFEYNADTAIPELKVIASKEIKPGLSSFVSNPEEAGAYLKPLIDEASQKLNALSVDSKQVQIHILASAGMRLLPFGQQNKIYAEVKKFLNDNSPFAIGQIKTISGKEEGLYGWLSVNYLEGTFQRKEPTLGSIDMGGASTQIAFAVPEMTINSNNTETLLIDQQSYTVFTESFLNLGQDRARESMLSFQEAKKCYPKLYPIDQERIGDFSLQECSSVYNDIIQKHAVKEKVAVPKDIQFVAYSGIYYVYDFFKANNQQPLAQKLEEVCNKSWPELQEIYGQNKYLSNFCANGTYIHELLFRNYELRDIQLKVVNKIQEKEVDWTLGAILYQLIKNKSVPAGAV